MEVQELVNIISNIQFKQELDWYVYIIIACVSGLSGFFVSYFKEKGKNFASKEDFKMLKEQLSENTALVEGIKVELSERTWITQQIWSKKQETYEAIFELLFHVKKYVDHQVGEFEEWEYINRYHPYFQCYSKEDEKSLRDMWEKDKEEYELWSKEPQGKKEAGELKKKYESAILELLQIIELKAIYISSNVGVEIEDLKNELQRTYDEEDWDDHFSRISGKVKDTIVKIQKISRIELKIET